MRLKSVFPLKMYLFDKTRHGRQDRKSCNNPGQLRWKTFLNCNPIFGAESTAAFDNMGNLYFGAHSGNFYSLSPLGSIRWTFTTKRKIYSSPVVLNNEVYFAGGDGFFYALSLEGKLLWIYDISKGYRGHKWGAIFSRLVHFPFTYNPILRRIILENSWSSPNSFENKILISAYGIGLHCLDTQGNLLWNFDLGFPRNQLSGVAIDNKGQIFCPSRKGISYALSHNDGAVLWSHLTMKYGEPWGTPVVCTQANRVIFFYSKGERAGLVAAYSLDGVARWQYRCGAIRGGASISSDERYAYFCDFNGVITKLNIADGVAVKSRQIADPLVQRSLWTTPTIDSESNILLSIKDGLNEGRIIKLTNNLDEIWSWKTKKVLSVPLIGKSQEIYFGASDGYYYCLNGI